MHEEGEVVGSDDVDAAVNLAAQKIAAFSAGHEMNAADRANGWNENPAFSFDVFLILSDDGVEPFIIAGEDGMAERDVTALIHELHSLLLVDP